MLSLRPSSRFDLHLHSDRSDGRYAPDEVLARCARGGLDVIALTDHDLGSAVRPGLHRIEGRDLYVLGGAEVSGMHDGREHHLLVYFRGEVPEGFRAFCREQCRARASRYERALENLGLAGLAAPADAEAREGTRALTRMHLARELVARGRAQNQRDAFARFVGDVHGTVPRLTLPLVEAIRVARSYGGLTSWAHPPVAAVERYVAELAAAGLQGLEGLRPRVTSDERRRYRIAAKQHDLFLTGGSDWHGWADDGDLGLFRLEAREIAPFVDALQAA